MATEMLQLEIPTFQEVLKDSDSNEQFLEELLCKFKHWLKLQTHLPQGISDQRLKHIIIAVKFNFEKAKRRLDMLYSIRHFIPEIYTTFDPFDNAIENIHNYFQLVVLSKLTPDNHRIFVARILTDDSSIYDIWTVIRYIMLLFEARLEEDTISSIIVIWDCTNTTLQHILKYSPPVIKAINTCMEAYCLRLKGLYLINAPQCINIFMRMAKSIMKTKLFNRIYVYASGIESVTDVVPKSLLPVEYDGEQPSMNTFTAGEKLTENSRTKRIVFTETSDRLLDLWRKKLAQRRDWFLEQNKCKTNESLRTNSSFDPNDIFGVTGTFRQLNID